MAKSDHSFGKLFNFCEVFRAEIESINRRRPPHSKVKLETESHDNRGEPVLRPRKDNDLVGLSLSGGGIRSAAFCLGCLQALHLTGVLKKVDYLSTVSGGGYIGASLSSGMHATNGKFPFEAKLDQDETPSLQHIRDWSNYLFPRGLADVLCNVSIYGRGLVATLVMIGLFLLSFAGITILANPDVEALGKPDIFGWDVPNPFELSHFGLTTLLLLIFLFLFLMWALVRSFTYESEPAELQRYGINYFAGAGVILIMFSAFCEVQPYIIHLMIVSPFLAVSLGGMTAVFASVVAAVGIFWHQLIEMINRVSGSRRLRQRIRGYLGTAAIWIAAAIVPVLLWMLYLRLSYWGIYLENPMYRYDPELPYRAPEKLQELATLFGDFRTRIAWLYLLGAALCFLLALLLRPNANSLHPLYRDRLSKTFLFEPKDVWPEEGADLQPKHMPLSQLAQANCPYHILNAALNVQDSEIANRRGRNADFFIFSGHFVGSETTRYVKTSDIEELAPELDLAAAMAISGAAVSANMGAATIKALTPTLALLNLRLGYWLRNPTWVNKKEPRNLWANFYYLLEILGLLNEKRRSVYLTDGGHIENLGIYQLLKRRCRVIIAIDAEADTEMVFSSLVRLERYARIDLGIRIELPWHSIRENTLKAGHEIDVGDYRPQSGPHCAIGEIQYPEGRLGLLIYIKASLTGDENDYIRSYRRRYPEFPHETTLDQLFSEEQFEVYRALGYHIGYGLFDRRDVFAFLDPQDCPRVADQIAYLDKLFPQNVDVATRRPGQRTTFASALEPHATNQQTASPSVAQSHLS